MLDKRNPIRSRGTEVAGKLFNHDEESMFLSVYTDSYKLVMETVPVHRVFNYDEHIRLILPQSNVLSEKGTGTVEAITDADFRKLASDTPLDSYERNPPKRGPKNTLTPPRPRIFRT